MIWSWDDSVDKDKMKECMFGMPMEKDKPPYFMGAVTYSDGNDTTWTHFPVGDTSYITVGGWWDE